MKTAYLVNQYPYASSTFIRREIAGVVAMGAEVVQFSIRRPETPTIDDADVVEAEKTRYILDGGAAGLVAGLLSVAMSAPLRVLKVACKTVKLGWRSDRGILNHLAYLCEACILWRWCRDMQVDHVHAHMGTNPAMVAMLCRLLGGPRYSFTAHGIETFDAPAFIAVGEKVGQSAFTVGVCDFGRSQLCRWSDVDDWAKIRVVRCGVDDTFLEHPKTSVPAVPRFVMVARLSPEKGHLVLCEAAGRLAKEGLHFDITLIGDGPMRGRIEQAIRRLGLQDCFHLLGWRGGVAVRDEILASRAMILPSFSEGLPVVIMEALALNRPVISTYIAGIPELVQPGVNGWLVPAGSVEALAGAMREAMEAPVERLEEMGRAGAERVREMHDASKEARKLAELFRASVEGRLNDDRKPAEVAVGAGQG